MSLNSEMSDLFAKLAALMDLKGESTFKSIAFSKVSRVLKDSTHDLRALVEANQLKELQGVGPSSQKIIEQYVKTGRSEDYEEVAASIPAGLIPMLEIPGLGPKTIALLWKERGITALPELVKAIDEGKLAGIKGIGDKKIDAIKQGIALRASASQRVGIVEALPIAEACIESLQKLPGVIQVQYAGSLRRCCETVGDVDIVCAVAKGSAESIGQAFATLPHVQRILAQGQTKVSVLAESGLQVDLRTVPESSFGAALQYFTGSKAHNVKLRGVAQQHKMTLNEWGLYRLDQYEKSEKPAGAAPLIPSIAGKTETEIYKALGLQYVEPEMREDRGEIEAAATGKLPKLLQLSDIHGDLHSHTTASDGRAGIEQMAQAAMNLGYKFLAITDHSKSSVIANGLSVERLMKHAAEIRKISDRLKGITLLVGCEVDILTDGRLDFEDEILAELDWVVASPHVSLKQNTEVSTARILRAIENRYVNVIGHPTGRIIQRREGLPLDLPKIFRAAAQSGTALELNAAWPRLDLNDVAIRAAIAAGGKITIDTDAHSTEGLDAMTLGVSYARRAWVEPRHVVNCMALAELRAFVKAKR